MVGTYGLLIWKNLIFSRVLAISQGEFGLTGKMGGRKSFFFFPLGWFLKFFPILGSDTHCFTLLFEILPLKPWEERSVLPRCKAGIVWDTLLGF